jgi:hypothetical protein
MSILSINEGFCGDCPIWGFEVGEYFPIKMEMEKKKFSQKRFGDRLRPIPSPL